MAYSDYDKIVVLAKRTYFGSTGKMSFGFITETLILSLQKINGKEQFGFRSPAGVWFPHKERIKFFRSMDTAQRWIDEHSLKIDGEKVQMYAARYGSLMRNPFED